MTSVCNLRAKGTQGPSVIEAYLKIRAVASPESYSGSHSCCRGWAPELVPTIHCVLISPLSIPGVLWGPGMGMR